MNGMAVTERNGSMDDHPIQDLMTTAMENLEKMTEVNTIIGEPIHSPDGSMIIPVSKVGFGFAAGGSEFTPDHSDEDATLPFGGGSGGGVSVTPVAFLIVKNDGVHMMHMDGKKNLESIAPTAVEKVHRLLDKALSDENKESSENEGKDKSDSDPNYTI